MKVNVGVTDRIIRVLIAIMLVGLITNQMATGNRAILLGILTSTLVLSSTFGVCPFYRILDINTTIQREK